MTSPGFLLPMGLLLLLLVELAMIRGRLSYWVLSNNLLEFTSSPIGLQFMYIYILYYADYILVLIEVMFLFLLLLKDLRDIAYIPLLPDTFGQAFFAFWAPLGAVGPTHWRKDVAATAGGGLGRMEKKLASHIKIHKTSLWLQYDTACLLYIYINIMG